MVSEGKRFKSMNTGNMKKNCSHPLFAAGEERVVKRSADRASQHGCQALAVVPHGEDSPRRRCARRPSLPQAVKRVRCRFIKQIKFPLILLFACLLSTKQASAQDVRGTVKDSSARAVPYASVNLKNSATHGIVAFAVTDTKGMYVLKLPDGTTTAGLEVEVRCVGYKTQVKGLDDIKIPVDFTLNQSINELASVVIKTNRPTLKISGDTTSYKVSQYANPQDRTIGEVLKKMPGITVGADGTISYNNKQITNLYIDGDNLLDDKYNIATGTIPQGSVEAVQAIENNQPVKMLQNKVMSDETDLNLKMKKGAKLHLVGQETAGAGLPGNYDEDLNAMMFKDWYKAINYLRGNNTGFDLQQEVISHNLANYEQRVDNVVPLTMLSLGSINDPNLERNRYLFDQAGMINLNNLFNLKNGVQLKMNFYYLHDSQKQDYSQQTTVLLPGDTVHYSETQHNTTRPDILHGQLGLLVNKDKYYLNDALIFDYKNQTSTSALTTNGTSVSQSFNDYPFNFSNELDVLRTFKSNNIFETYSYISHSNEPENRTIGSDYSAQLFNNGLAYNLLLQNVNIPAWYTNNYLGIKIPGNLFTKSFRAGFSVQSQNLSSNLNVLQNDGSVSAESDSSRNNLNWTRKKVYTEAAWDLPGDNLKANLTLPLSLQQINYSDGLYHLTSQLTRLYFSPQFRLKYKTGGENYLNLLYNYRNETGTIADVYRGYILTDYRTLMTNDASLAERQNQLAAASFSYKKALSLFFFNFGVIYNHIGANNISSVVISNNLQRGITLPYANSANSWTLNGYISKYSFLLNTTFSGTIQWQTNRSNQIQNNALLPFNTNTTTVTYTADTKITTQINTSYKAVLTQTGSYSGAGVPGFHVGQLFQQASVTYEPADEFLFSLSGEHYFTRQQGNPDLKYFFADASAKFRIKKWKTDIQLSANNFLNTKTYNMLFLTGNTLTASSYTLPGRIILLKVMFNI